MADKARLYIVDDEKMAIEYFKSLARQASPTYEVVGEAFHGPTAFDEVTRMKPDIVFIDIRMPIMNGIVLAEKILKRNGNQKIVFLTSYRDFDYVKKGMELGVNCYLLKNELTVETLEKEVGRIMQQIRVEKEKLHTYLEYNLKQFLEDDTGSIYGEDYIYQTSSLNRFALLVINRNRPVTTEPEYREHLIYHTMLLEELDYPAGITCRNALRISEDQWVGIFFIHENVSDSQKLLLQSADQMINKFESQDIKVSCVISAVTRKFTDLPKIYKRIHLLTRYMFFWGSGRILMQQEAEQHLDARKQVDLQITDLVSMLDEENLDGTRTLLSHIFRESREDYTIAEFTRLIVELAGVMKRFARRKKLDENLLPEKTEFWSIEEVQDYMFNLSGEIFKRLHLQEQNQYSKNVIQMLEYIHTNFHKNIALQDIAEAVQLSEGHARKCFKQEVGVTVVDYLTNYRIDRAKEMIRNGERITRVYEKAGFASSQYFSYVFKKNEGISPSEFGRHLR